MLEARTAWAIVLLLAPTGVAAAGGVAALKAPQQHTAYVEIVLDGDRDRSGLVTVEAHVDCLQEGSMDKAIAWVKDEDCTTPPGAAVYVTDASAPSPTSASMIPTGTVYAYEDADRVWTVREYTYAGEAMDVAHHAYVMAPDVADRIDDEGRGEPVRGVVDLDKMGVAPGESVELSTTVGPAPQVTPEDPTVERVGDQAPEEIPAERALGVRG